MCAKEFVVNPENGFFIQFLSVADQDLDQLAQFGNLIGQIAVKYVINLRRGLQIQLGDQRHDIVRNVAWIGDLCRSFGLTFLPTAYVPIRPELSGLLVFLICCDCVLLFTHLFLSSTELPLLVTRNRVNNYDKIEHSKYERTGTPEILTATGGWFF